MADTLRVLILYGGRSGEHEVSLVSAASVFRNLDRRRFEPVLVGIDKRGVWRLADAAALAPDVASLPMSTEDCPWTLPAAPARPQARPALAALDGSQKTLEFDVAFPVMHGPLCEDGTLQGLFELADIPYVGCGVLASAVAMDKDTAKRLAQAAGIPVVPWVLVQAQEYLRDRQHWHRRIADELGLPLFIKPSNLGSSVGVMKVKRAEQLGPALEQAFLYDRRVLAEKAIDGREIEVAVLENIDGPPLVSVVGEITPRHEFYSYQAKYQDNQGAVLSIPAPLEPAQSHQVRDLAERAFAALCCQGLTRCDFFLDRRQGCFYFNEMNTLPGFTSISMYPKLIAASGVAYDQLLTRLIELALLRHQQNRQLRREH